MSSAPDRALTDRIVWIDCEMTGLSLENDALVEVAALVTDFELNILGEGVDVVIRPTDEALEQMGDFVREMHTKSGLIIELADGVTMEKAQRLVLDYVREWVPEPRKAPLGGNTVATDRGFLARDMPELEEHLHYRIIDVSSIKELSRRWFPRAYFAAPAKNGGHRALADIRESIAELRYYRGAVFVDPPGRGSDELRALAAEHVVDHSTPVSGAAPEAASEAVRSTPGEQVR
ncbi:oligoribonuclease [Knoellia sp. Soil729]|uniref:oligoribonuclease n=1 Tax=Knoellia sp. Soil729 TaxID=1736394 RepID=UPI0009EAD983|nr:oligoribonuclease [Knoellia sp. Soil729]